MSSLCDFNTVKVPVKQIAFQFTLEVSEYLFPLNEIIGLLL